MILYLDASALVKRYVAEPGSDLVAASIAQAHHVVCCRVGFVEVYRAISLADLTDSAQALEAFEQDWDKMVVIEVHDLLVRRAARLAVRSNLRSLDALHLAAADSLGRPELRLLTWDRRLWQAAQHLGIEVLPAVEP